MKGQFKYPIILKKKVPLISEFISFLLMFCLVISAVSWFLYFPSGKSGNEMKSVAVITRIPENTKWLILYSGLGLIFFYFLHAKLRIIKKGYITFLEETLLVETKTKIDILSVEDISKIQFLEPRTHFSWSNEKFIVFIQMKNLETIRFQLKDYGHAEEIVENFISYKDLNTGLQDIDSWGQSVEALG